MLDYCCGDGCGAKCSRRIVVREPLALTAIASRKAGYCVNDVTDLLSRMLMAKQQRYCIAS